jgi:hypothetical protein
MNPIDQARDQARGKQYLQAVKRGSEPLPDSPASKSLLASYRRWQEREEAVKSDAKTLAELRLALEGVAKMLEEITTETTKARASAAVSTPEVREEAAQMLATQAMRDALKGDVAVGAAIAAGFASYKNAGGKLTDAAWRKSFR